MTFLALALAALCTAILLYLMWQQPESDDAPAARTAPPDPVAETVDKWMHDWMRGRA